MRHLFVVLVLVLFCTPVLANSAYSPRESGLEPPGGPQKNIGLPSVGSFGRTSEGGMGYTDAYGNTISGEMPKPKEHKRLPQGAYGHYERDDVYSRPLPDPAKGKQSPAWAF